VKALRLPIGEGDILCIDWDERSLRILEAGASRSGVKVRTAVRVPMTAKPTDPAAMGELLRKTLAEHRVRARRAIVNIPRQDALLNLLSLPKGTQDELAAMVHIQIAKDLPFAKDQTVIDFAVSPAKGEDATLDVWVAAVRNSIIDYYRQAITAAGLRLERVGLRPYANMAAINAGVEQTGRTLVVDIGPSMTEIDVIRDGRLAYSRSATVGAVEGELTVEGSAAMDDLLVEVNRTLGAYRSTDSGAKIDRIILAGTATIDDSVLGAFQERFGAPAQVFSTPPNLKWRDQDAGAAPFSSAIGLALSSVTENLYYFNLLAPKEPESERRERIRQVPYKAAIIVGLCALGAIAAYYPLHQRKAEIATIQRDIDQLNSDKADRDELAKLLGDLEDWQRQNNYWIDHLLRIAEVFPSTKDVYMTKVDFKESGEIVLEVQATDMFQAGNIVQAVRQIKEKDAKGKLQPLYTARVGGAAEANDPKYAVTDHVIIQIKSMAQTGTARR
jgi:Tfp pilus assembly PilM family ATPase